MTIIEQIIEAAEHRALGSTRKEIGPWEAKLNTLTRLAHHELAAHGVAHTIARVVGNYGQLLGTMLITDSRYIVLVKLVPPNGYATWVFRYQTPEAHGLLMEGHYFSGTDAVHEAFNDFCERAREGRNNASA